MVAVKPQVQFLNHSCLIISDGATSILCDPWFKGTAFDSGWRLILEESHDIAALEFNYIWISHEHPDHFSPLTLAGLKKPTTFLYQKTRDGKVAAYLRSKGHSVIELEDGQPVKLGEVSCTLFFCDGYDSALLTRFSDGSTFLNANDARLELGDVIKKISARCEKLDSLAIQFSYANWAGNEGDALMAMDQHKLVLDRITLVNGLLKPRQIILFAAFVFFSHEENFYWNKNFWLKPTVMALSQEVSSDIVVPIPDCIIPISDAVSLERVRSNNEAIRFWTEHHNNLVPKDFSGIPLSVSESEESYNLFYDRLWAANDHGLATQMAPSDFALIVNLRDLALVVEIGLFTRRFSTDQRRTADVHVSSRTLDFLFRKEFGRGTISINSKIQFNYRTAHRFFIFFFIYYANNIGRFFQDGELSWNDLEALKRLSVLQSIFRLHPEAESEFLQCLRCFVG